MNHDSQTQFEAQLQPQPFAPSFSMRSYFLAVGLLGAMFAVVFLFGSTKLQVLFVILLAAIALFLLCVALCFLVAFLIGALREVLFQPILKTESPFATEAMPPQVIPRQAKD